MGQTNQIEYVVETDILALLVTALAGAAAAEHYLENIGTPSGPYVTVRAEVSGEAFPGAGGLSSGYYVLTVFVAAHVSAHDDPTGATLAGLLGTIRGVLADSALPATLTAASAAVTYHGAQPLATLYDTEGSWRVAECQYSLWANPINQ
jgi:hypothetical protein